MVAIYISEPCRPMTTMISCGMWETIPNKLHLRMAYGIFLSFSNTLKVAKPPFSKEKKNKV